MPEVFSWKQNYGYHEPQFQMSQMINIFKVSFNEYVSAVIVMPA